MSDIVCVTNRALVREDFLVRIGKIAAAHPAAIILREKDLPEREYQKLAKRVLEICRQNGTPCVLHSFVGVALELGAKAVHLPLPVLRSMAKEQKESFSCIGASCHSVQELLEAQSLGCTYVTAGHIFETDCKRGLPGRGLAFLKELCEAASVPVYAIGGIDETNVSSVLRAGADGACLMSALMQCDDVQRFLEFMEA